MATTQRNLLFKQITFLKRTFHKGDFWQLMHLLQQIKQSHRFKNIKILYKTEPNLSFPKQAFANVSFDQKNNLIEITVNGFGLIGSAGILPNFITEWISQQRHLKDNHLLWLLESFQQRTHQLHYQAWLKSRIYLQQESFQSKFDYKTPTKLMLQSLVTATVPLPKDFNYKLQLAFFPLFSLKARSAEGLAQLLGYYLLLPVTIKEFTEYDQDIPINLRAYLIKSQADQSSNASLGAHFTLGTRVNMEVYHFTVVITIDSKAINRYLQYKTLWEKQIKELVPLYLGQHLTFRIEYQFNARLDYRLGKGFFLL